MIHLINEAIQHYEGRVTARDENDTQIRLRFPYEGKALRFHATMDDLGVTSQVQELNPTHVVVTIR